MEIETSQPWQLQAVIQHKRVRKAQKMRKHLVSFSSKKSLGQVNFKPSMLQIKKVWNQNILFDFLDILDHFKKIFVVTKLFAHSTLNVNLRCQMTIKMFFSVRLRFMENAMANNCIIATETVHSQGSISSATGCSIAKSNPHARCCALISWYVLIHSMHYLIVY